MTMLEHASTQFGAGFSPQGFKSIVIAQLVMQESGTYNPMYSRPYQSYVDAHTLDSVTQRVEAAGGQTISGQLMAGIASNIISPSATPQGELIIPQGWSERRIRFYMEVHVTPNSGNPYIYYIQGYTNHLGITEQGDVDPRMEFIINSFIQVSRAYQQTPYGMITRDIITESAHVINGQIQYQIPQDQNIYLMRPHDVFGGVQSAYLENGYQYAGNNAGFTDSRIILNGESIRSNRNNNLPANYLASLVNNYQTSAHLLDWGQKPVDIYARARDLTWEAPVNDNLFIRALANVKGMMHNTTTFTIKDLEKIDNNVSRVTQYFNVGPVARRHELHNVGQTSYWNGTDRSTVVANVLCNAVPALMMDLFILKMHCRSTNHDIGGQMNTTIIDAQSVTNADMTRNYEMFKRRLETEVMRDLTYGNQDTYMLEINSNVFGDTTISVSMGSEPMTTFTVPSFCDSLMTPVLTMDKSNFFNVSHDIETLMNSINDVNGATLAVNTSI